MIVVDEGLRILHANRGFSSLVAWADESLLGRALSDVVPSMSQGITTVVRRALESGEPTADVIVSSDAAELALDVLPIGARRHETSAVIVLSDPRHRVIDDVSEAGRAFFDLARRLARADTDESTAVIEEALRFVVERCGLDRAYVRLVADDEVSYVTPYEAHRPGLPPLATTDIPIASRAWANERFARGEFVAISSLEELPPDAKEFRDALEQIGVHTTVGVPVLDGPRLLGYVAYVAREPRAWSPGAILRLRFLGEAIAAILARRRAEEDIRFRVHFEELLSTAAARFVFIAPEDVDAEIQRTLEKIAVERKLDRAVLMQLDDTGVDLAVTHEWCAPGVASIKALFTGPVTTLSPLVRKTLAGEAVGARAEDAEPGSDADALLRRMEAQAFVLAPLHIEGRVRGVMMLQLTHRRRDSLRGGVARVKLVAEVIAAALTSRAARERVQRWERRFAQILESAMDGVILIDGAGIVKDWTAQATSVLGVGRELMLGNDLARLILVEDRSTLAAKIAATLASHAPAQRFELRALCGAGRVVPVELSMTRLDRAEGTLVAAFIRDITDRKRAEAEKQRAFDDVSRQKRTLERERDYLREEQTPAIILGTSPAIRRAVELIDAVAETTSSVLLLGESGVGKEVFAAALHARSRRADGPFVKVNCASVPGSLFESEFFGHAKGSFTGAVKERIGRFELADGGTLFLDEVGEIPLELQAKLLRVLQEGEIERVGEDRTRKLDVRIVVATNRDLEQEAEAGRFRRDLYYRLSTFPIAIPKLRERGEDVLLLARHFLARHAGAMRRFGLSFTPADEARLLAYEWPGNVRELNHVVERAVILSRTPPLRLDLALPHRGGPRPEPSPELLRDDDLRRLERDNLMLALKRADGRVSGTGGAAELLGMNPSTLRDRLKAFKISRD
ncbi:Anaerobic nitric oxide reductase transcription regulator NorR [Minicystis rosea]|nr:Anaerobic nitric oxide reductase transcription regulator NorR [Minicystis rosea]